jgi:hypothetical protein
MGLMFYLVGTGSWNNTASENAERKKSSKLQLHYRSSYSMISVGLKKENKKKTSTE